MTESQSDAAPDAIDTAPPPGLPGRTVLLTALLLMTIATVAHYGGIGNGYIWDDDHYVTENPVLRDLDGLRRIWLEPTSVPQYYPLVHTSFWVQYQLWELDPAPYHLVNVLCHALTSALLFLVLLRLFAPLREDVGRRQAAGRLLLAATPALLFAVHPVHVESVAWITERKNVLSAVFYMLAALVWMRAVRWPRVEWRVDLRFIGWQVGALALFGCALLSKTVTCSLPAVMLLVLWWRAGRNGRAGWTRAYTFQALVLVPWLIVGAVMARTTAKMESLHVGANGPEWDFSIADRCLIAGRALWTYLAKLAWPEPLAFFYTRWTIDDTVWWQYLYPIGFALLVIGAWLWRRRVGRGPLVALLVFAGTLLPALGFINVYPHRYSFVADHFNYLGTVPVFVLLAAGLARLATTPTRLRVICGGLAVVALACIVQSHRHSRAFASEETLWLDTIAKTPTAWIAYNNLGEYYRHADEPARALPYFQQAIALNPRHIGAYNNLGLAHIQLGQFADATDVLLRGKAAFEALPRAYQPQNGAAYLHTIINLGNALASQRNFAGARLCYLEAHRLRADFPMPLILLGQLEIDAGNPAAAIPPLTLALEHAPHDDHARALLTLATELAGAGPQE